MNITVTLGWARLWQKAFIMSHKYHINPGMCILCRNYSHDFYCSIASLGLTFVATEPTASASTVDVFKPRGNKRI